MDTEEQTPLVTINIEMGADNEWGMQLLALLPPVLAQGMFTEQFDAFWVEVKLVYDPNTQVAVIGDEDAVCARLNQKLGQELLSWRVETVCAQFVSQKLVSVLLLMTTVSLEDIMALGQ